LKSDLLISNFNKEGVPTLMLKGMPYSLLYYKDLGIRPMGDIDILVPIEYLEKAIKILEKLGHHLIPYELKFRNLIHAYHSFNSEGFDIDIHRQVFFYLNDENVNYDFWKDKQELNLIKEKTYTLSDTHQMFHTILHGRWDNSAKLRWIVDAWMIDKNAKSTIDWKWIIVTALQNKLTFAFKPALLFLLYELNFKSLIPFEKMILQMEMNQLEKLLFKRKQEIEKDSFFKYYFLFDISRLIYRLYFEGKVPYSIFKWQLDKIRLGFARKIHGHS